MFPFYWERQGSIFNVREPRTVLQRTWCLVLLQLMSQCEDHEPEEVRHDPTRMNVVENHGGQTRGHNQGKDL